ncbi:hypothetical protein PEC302110_09880 [Pectobacterium araliae]|uniref:Uncharacterized protein n=1 Tax=Pectobacterium araliae TaxID=3073862 RepID=A0AAN0KDE0_9GAMM|nr:hypothetical protein PEC302110_09880 [Pectobacterium sp. MAFF 302110]
MPIGCVDNAHRVLSIFMPRGVVIIHDVKEGVVAIALCHRNAMIIYSRDDGCRGGIKSLESGSKNQMYAL